MRDNFKRVFDDFCRDKDVVVGAPAVFFFAGEHVVLRGGLGIAQQLPRRVWVALKYDATRWGMKNSIHIPKERGFHRVWLPEGGMRDFQDCQPPHGGTEWKDQTEPLENLVNGLLARPVIKDFWCLEGLPFTVHILTELRSAGGCNFSGAFAAALMTALRLAAELFKAAPDKTLQQCLSEGESGCQHFGWTEQHLKDPGSLLHKINRAALVVETYLHGGSASGYGTLCSLFPSPCPFIYFREAPSAQGVPEELPVDWKALYHGDLTSDDWACIERTLISHESGMRYELVPINHLVSSPMPSDYPFSFALIFSGRPKNTAAAIEQVRDLGRSLHKTFQRLAVPDLGSESLRTWPQDRPEPQWRAMLARLCQDSESATGSLYDGLMPAGFVVLKSLLECFGSGRYPQEAALKDLAHAIWGVQGALDQLFLVDENARQIAGDFMKVVAPDAEMYGMKYTGGANGGYLVCVGPPELSPGMLRSFVDKVRSQGKRELTDVTLDYISTTELPDGQGVCVRLPHVSYVCCFPSRLMRFGASGETWQHDTQAPITIPEWKWEMLRNSSVREDGWCLLEINPEVTDKASRSHVIIQGQDLDKFLLTGRGEGALARAILLLVQKNTEMTNAELCEALESDGLTTTDSYFGDRHGFEKLLQTPIEALPVWRNIFGPFRLRKVNAESDKTQFALFLPPKSASSRVFALIRERS